MTVRLLEGLNVLIVEDEFLIASTIAFTLAEHGAEIVGPAMTVDQGMNLAIKDGINAALLDLKLGGDVSIPIAQALQGRRVPFIFMTGYSDRVVLREFSGSPTIQKPFIESDLVALCQQTFKAVG